jgi:hypothetical protein
MQKRIIPNSLSRRTFLANAGVASLSLMPLSSFAKTMIQLPSLGGPAARWLATDFPEKGSMILQRTRPPLLETPFEVFDRSIFTPNDRFFVRWHWAVIPPRSETDAYRSPQTVIASSYPSNNPPML